MLGTAREFIRGVILQTTRREHTCIDRSVKIYDHRLCSNSGYSADDLPGAIDDRGGAFERE